MTIDSQGVAAAAEALRAARAHRRPIAPISSTHGIGSLEAAYAVAEVNTRARLAAGARIVGKKVGLTSKAVQQQLGVDQPDFGMLFNDMELLHGDDVPAQRLLQPKVEAEVAFVVGRDLAGPAPSYAEFLASLACALLALEIVDSAIADWKITLVDTVADNASCGLYVLGNQPVAIEALQFGELGMSMPFWFDLLGRLVKLRGAGRKPDDDRSGFTSSGAVAGSAGGAGPMLTPTSTPPGPDGARPSADTLSRAEAELTPAQIVQVQAALPMPSAQCTGRFDSETRGSIKVWQEKTGQPTADGVLISLQIERLLKGTPPVAASP